MPIDSHKEGDSIAGQSAAHFIANDDSLASLLLNHRMKVRDFIVLSFLADQGSMTILRLSRVVGMEPKDTLQSLRRLSSANLVLRDLESADDESIVRLTTRGEDIAERIRVQIE